MHDGRFMGMANYELRLIFRATAPPVDVSYFPGASSAPKPLRQRQSPRHGDLRRQRWGTSRAAVPEFHPTQELRSLLLRVYPRGSQRVSARDTGGFNETSRKSLRRAVAGSMAEPGSSRAVQSSYSRHPGASHIARWAKHQRRPQWRSLHGDRCGTRILGKPANPACGSQGSRHNYRRRSPQVFLHVPWWRFDESGI